MAENEVELTVEKAEEEMVHTVQDTGNVMFRPMLCEFRDYPTKELSISRQLDEVSRCELKTATLVGLFNRKVNWVCGHTIKYIFIDFL